jgi:hypothetical protein
MADSKIVEQGQNCLCSWHMPLAISSAFLQDTLHDSRFPDGGSHAGELGGMQHGLV